MMTPVSAEMAARSVRVTYQPPISRWASVFTGLDAPASAAIWLWPYPTVTA